jgi:hypothetical protein
LGALVEQRGADPGPERRSAEEAQQRQGAGDQAPAEADRCEGDGEDDDPDVDEVQRASRKIGLRACEGILTTDSATTFSA